MADTAKQIVNETIYIQKWPDAATVGDTVGVLPSEVVAITVQTVDGVLADLTEEIVTDPDLVAAVNARAEKEKDDTSWV